MATTPPPPPHRYNWPAVWQTALNYYGRRRATEPPIVVPLEVRTATGTTITAVLTVNLPPARLIVRAGTPEVTVTPRPDVPEVEVGVSLNENLWDFGTTTFGIAVGSVIGHTPGAIVGGVVMYVWGRWRWRERAGR